MGLRNGSLTFQRMVNNLFAGAVRKGLFVYLDDLVVVSKDFLKLCPIVAEENTRSRILAYEVIRDKGTSHCCSKLVRDGNHDSKTTEVVYAYHNIGRALVTAWQLEKIDAYNFEGSGR